MFLAKYLDSSFEIGWKGYKVCKNEKNGRKLKTKQGHKLPI